MIEDLERNKFLVVKNFISEERAKSLSEEYRNYCKDNNLSGDRQVENSSANGDYISFLELLCEKTPEVSKIIGETVLPTYAYSRVYRNGNTLKKHTDRDACEVSLTLHLDGDKEWIIYVETPKKSIAPIRLKSGDALLYMGCEAPHWRNEFEGTYYTQVFLHYVKSRGKRSYTYFDRIREEDLKKKKKKKKSKNKSK